MSIIGTSKPIHDAWGKVAGYTQFCGDMKMSRMLHAAVIFSEISHGIVKNIDVSHALAMKGVIDVIHCFNTTDKLYNRYRSQAIQSMPEDERIFNSHVRFLGDRIGAVIAESESIARRAAKKIKIVYEPLPYHTSSDEVLSGLENRTLADGHIVGDVEFHIGEEPTYPKDVVRVRTQTKLSRITHACMETHSAIADYDPYSGELTIWSPNQATHGIRTVIGDLFDMPYNKVRSIKTTMGSSFGAKQEWMLEPVVAAAAIKTGRPVKLVYSRKETMISTVSRSPMDAKVETVFTKEGKLLALYIDNVVDAGAYIGNTKDYSAVVANKLFRCYTYPYLYYRGRAVLTHSPVSGAYRGWTAPEAALMVEHNLNKAAKLLGIDPIELRLKNVATEGDFDPKVGIPIGAVRTKECLELGREKFDWEGKKKRAVAFNRKEGRFKRGIAVGCGGHVNGYYPKFGDFATVELRLTEDGSVIASLSLHDHGCGAVTVMKMIIAETTGIDMERITIKEADTNHTPLDMGCYSSRTVYVIGKAAQNSAELLIEISKKNIAEIHQANTNDVVFRDGKFYVESHGVKEVYDYKRVGQETMRLLKREVIALEQYVSVSNPSVTGTHFAEVEVDTYTGMVKILSYLAAHDVGKVLNREICEAQIQGAVMMGCGAALSEEMITHTSGHATSSFKNYHLINAYEAPNIEILFVEDGKTDGPFGAKSIGEICHVPPAATINGAVNDALRSELGEIPLNPDSIIRFLVENKNNREEV